MGDIASQSYYDRLVSYLHVGEMMNDGYYDRYYERFSDRYYDRYYERYYDSENYDSGNDDSENYYDRLVSFLHVGEMTNEGYYDI